MIPTRSPRTLAALLLAMTLVGALFASPALAAKPPKPGGTASPAVPPTVSPSTADETNYVRFNVLFTNTTNSSLQQVTMEAETPADSDLEAVVAAPLVGGMAIGSTCDDSGVDLSCIIGTVEAGLSVTLSVVYEVPVTTADKMDIAFIFKSTGAPGSDPRRSHGDDFPVIGTVFINEDGDFAGTYLYDASDLDVATDQELTKRGNPQSTEAIGPQTGFPLTVQEVAGNTNLYNCPPGETCFGEWSVVNVNNGLKYEPGFVVVIGYDSVPGSASGVEFVHLVGPSLTPSFIRESCDEDTTVNCIADVDNVSGDLFYTLILDNNGPIRGI